MKRILPVAYLLTLVVPTILFATSVDKQDVGKSTVLNGSSTNYLFNAEVGAPAAGQSSSTNYIYDHGMYWGGDDVLTALIQWATPEGRVGTAETNDDSVLYLTLIPTGGGSAIRIPADTSSNLTTNNDGTLDDVVLDGVDQGTYDVYLKTNQHLRKKLANVTIGSGKTVLNFTTTNNSSPKGVLMLRAGDINTSNTPGVFGDNTVNAVDISAIVPVLNNIDATGNALNQNLNQDGSVNAVDISILLNNLDQNGE